MTGSHIAGPPLPGEWVNDAACVGHPSDPWHDGVTVRGSANDVGREAIRICGSCPCRSECLAYALDNEIGDGIWGGRTPRQRNCP